MDAKFFKYPPKSLHYSVVVDEEYARDKLIMNKEARKFFTRLIYKKALFAKIVKVKMISKKSKMTKTRMT